MVTSNARGIPAHGILGFFLLRKNNSREKLDSKGREILVNLMTF